MLSSMLHCGPGNLYNLLLLLPSVLLDARQHTEQQSQGLHGDPKKGKGNIAVASL